MTDPRNPGSAEAPASDEEPVEISLEAGAVESEAEPLGADSFLSAKPAPEPDGTGFRG